MTGIDASIARAAAEKASLLCNTSLKVIPQEEQLRNPSARISWQANEGKCYLGEFATAHAGLLSGDYPRFGRCFWELPLPVDGWTFQQSTVKKTTPWGGREHILFWQHGRGEYHQFVRERLGEKGMKAWIRGTNFSGKMGVAVSAMQELPVSLYAGDLFDNNTMVVLPKEPEYIRCIWAFCSSPDFHQGIRQFNKKISVEPGYIASVPFDFEHWRKVADEASPLPEPYSNDPTQWLFEGHPAGSTEPLQVAVARLLGYRWPQQKPDDLEALADTDGILPLPAVAGEQPGVERLRAFLAAAYSEDWSPAQAERMLAAVGFGGKGLDLWLRDGFFEQHCRLFHNRPFIWHIWDGRKDGFSALVNYHMLDLARLNRLIYTYLGAWIAMQQADRNAEVAGADGRLVAALKLQEKLQAIHDGEAAPDHKSGYDIYVRWKPLEKQPLGWEPDLNDGVRLNIRPFVTAEVLRSRFTINWKKDRGTNPDGSERLNDRHYTLAEKRAARTETAT